MTRLLSIVIRACRLMPAALDRAHLEWALREIPPLHPDVRYIVRRINELEARR